MFITVIFINNQTYVAQCLALCEAKIVFLCINSTWRKGYFFNQI